MIRLSLTLARIVLLLLVALGMPGWSSSLGKAQGTAEGRIAFTAWHRGNWDIYTIRTDGSDLRRVTIDPSEERDPAWSPDGTALAYTARRGRQWDIYVRDLSTGQERQLTADRPYDGLPAWSPDGQWIAYESMAAGDLDVWLIPSEGGEAVNLTQDSPAGDFGPAWAPVGPYRGWLAFTSWRFGDKDVFLINPTSGELRQITHDPSDEELAGWSADGRALYLFRDEDERREVWSLDVMNLTAGPVRRTWLTRVTAVTATDEGLAVIYRRADGEGLLRFSDDGDVLPTYLVWRAHLSGRIAWHPSPLASGELVLAGATALDDAPLPNDGQRVARFVELPGVEASGPASLSSEVADSFLALRRRVREETGYDFLSRLSEAWRPPFFESDASDYLSWHKTGRAVDLLLDYFDESGQPLLERVREDMGGETFWRLYLRCRDQDGSCGRPLTDRTWDLSYRARAYEGWGRGGLPGVLLGRYFVDFTALAREYGWRRISSYEEPDFDWRTNLKALEYWHYERRDGQQWYLLMLQVLDRSQAEAYFTWEEAMRHGVDEFYAVLKGLPLPASMGRWRALRP
ncbi:MAG: DPP IV N-terminal domain-containing protein [Anaerolineae bacterium]|nr:DPP IV N-terminal domain-containing protein [Anaerolineae bacterium]MDW8100121.1 DPP IV N-terminal domain-containing protein [Anaerolineae bacterium]